MRLTAMSPPLPRFGDLTGQEKTSASAAATVVKHALMGEIYNEDGVKVDPRQAASLQKFYTLGAVSHKEVAPRLMSDEPIPYYVYVRIGEQAARPLGLSPEQAVFLPNERDIYKKIRPKQNVMLTLTPKRKILSDGFNFVPTLEKAINASLN